jgi:electron transport complex protein RnfC
VNGKKSLHGVTVRHCKNTADSKTEIMPIPDRVYIAMVQQMGAPCEAVVKVGDMVRVGQLIGRAPAFMSAPIHSSVSGKWWDWISRSSSLRE